MKNKNTNRIDQLIINLLTEFSKIPNFELTKTDSDANRMFNVVVNKFSDIHDFKTLYKRYYIPASNRAIVDTRNELKTSFYRKVLNITDNQLKENYFDTIRLGYVGLFHKVENYVKDILAEANLIFNDGKTGIDSIEKFFEKNYQFKFNNWNSDLTLNKINWISNCVKHYDGYPKKEPKFQCLSNLPENEKIKIDHETFFKDMEYVSDSYYQFKLTQIFTMAVFKMWTDDQIVDVNVLTDEQRAKYLDLENIVTQMMI